MRLFAQPATHIFGHRELTALVSTRVLAQFLTNLLIIHSLHFWIIYFAWSRGQLIQQSRPVPYMAALIGHIGHIISVLLTHDLNRGPVCLHVWCFNPYLFSIAVAIQNAYRKWRLLFVSSPLCWLSVIRPLLVAWVHFTSLDCGLSLWVLLHFKLIRLYFLQNFLFFFICIV